jgi:hypothetical protein
MFSKGTPSTMTKEWQEATNEMLKVCLCFSLSTTAILFYLSWKLFLPPSTINSTFQIKTNHNPHPRNNAPSPSPVSHPKATPAPDKCNPHPRRSNCRSLHIHQSSLLYLPEVQEKKVDRGTSDPFVCKPLNLFFICQLWGRKKGLGRIRSGGWNSGGFCA